MTTAQSDEALAIGIDLGTSGVRACAIDQAAQPHALASLPLPPPQRRDGRIQQEPMLWWRCVEQLLQQLLRQIDPVRVRRIAVDGTSATLLLCDRYGQPLTPALMYNDQSSRDHAAQINELAPAESAARGAGSSLAKLLQLRAERERPEAALALHQADWITAQLSGRVGVSDENNALKLGYDVIARRWPQWLDQLALSTESGLGGRSAGSENWDGVRLPEVVAPGSPLSRIDPHVAQRFGLDPETVIVAGTTDSTAAFLATGAAQPGDGVTSLGSTLVLKLLGERPIFAPRYGLYSHRLGDRWLIGGASNSGGAVLLQHFSREQLNTLTRSLEPLRPTGLDYYPLPRTGERFPIADPDLPSRIDPRPADRALFLQALLEGISSIEQRGYQLLHELGAPALRQLWSIGGGSSNAPWREIRQQRLGVPFRDPLHPEAAYGCARLAAFGLNALGGVGVATLEADRIPTDSQPPTDDR